MQWNGYPRYIKAVRVSLVEMGYDEQWVDTEFRDAIEKKYLGYNTQDEKQNWEILLKFWMKMNKFKNATLKQLSCVFYISGLTLLFICDRILS